MTIAKVQHYVPQFLLRNFGNGKKDQVWVFEKASGRSFPSNTKNVASESRFYDFEYEGEELSLEPWLAQLEGEAKSVISAILNVDSVARLAREQREILAAFLAVQLMRTRTFREEWAEFPRMLRQAIAERGEQVAPGSQVEELIRDLTENQAKEETARMVLTAPAQFADFFLDKDWVLAATTRRHPFIVCDNPLARQNMFDLPGMGNLGLRSPGIEIYLPLSPTRALAMWCPTLTEQVHRGALSTAVNRAGGDAVDPAGVHALSDALLSGGPVSYSVANVENFNSLQVAWSERYIFSSINDFHLANEMVASEARLRGGPRSTVM